MISDHLEKLQLDKLSLPRIYKIYIFSTESSFHLLEDIERHHFCMHKLKFLELE